MSLYRGISLTIGGSDSGGGAGIQADLKTFSALKIFGTTAITAITAQNSQGVQKVLALPPEIVSAQMNSVLGDFSVESAKTGMVSEPDIILAVADTISKTGLKKLVVDPVMVAQSGDSLLAPKALDVLVEKLLPLALVVTPNVPEAERLTSLSIKGKDEMAQAAEAISKLGPKGVLVKGGHLDGKIIYDVFYFQGQWTIFEQPRIPTLNTHGTGCTLSAAISAELAGGCGVSQAVERGRTYLLTALQRGFQPGSGPGPVGHGVEMDWL